MRVVVERSPDPVDLNSFADAYARIVRRLATERPEELRHVG